MKNNNDINEDLDNRNYLIYVSSISFVLSFTFQYFKLKKLKTISINKVVFFSSISGICE